MTQVEKQERIDILEESINDRTFTLEKLYKEKHLFHPFLQDYIVERYCTSLTCMSMIANDIEDRIKQI